MDTNSLYFSFGRPFSPIYSSMMLLRERCYRKGIFSTYRPSVPVISIGNLTLGGTGKTPMVEHVAQLLQKSGLQPAIVSRGYGGRSKEAVNLVSDGKNIELDALTAGDEPRLLAEKLPGVFVLTGAVRKLPIQRAVEMGAGVIVLDDGFQHLAVQRDLNIVLFNSDFLAGNSRVFPGGHLREPVSSLKRADTFVLTDVREDNRERAKMFADLLSRRFPGKPTCFSRYSAVGMVNAQNGEPIDFKSLTDVRSLGIAGIARPSAFASSLASAGITISGLLSFPDHVAYNTGKINQIEKALQHNQAQLVITTEKDAVKLRDAELSVPVYSLRMSAQPDEGFDTLILDSIKRRMDQKEG
ncbi:tetraacyldisaccharide 4'-kinase [Desulfogranum japonicum]|uniref:tetraacyldisaccharide 4'-kinase n=1 Tax=Desulfogranum japonicum TaxID=231447 RepID=UPI000551E96C|nr:tetraacyldisaccharide 4'-kinase [Desulfogranum japonicum]